MYSSMPLSQRMHNMARIYVPTLLHRISKSMTVVSSRWSNRCLHYSFLYGLFLLVVHQMNCSIATHLIGVQYDRDMSSHLNGSPKIQVMISTCLHQTFLFFFIKVICWWLSTCLLDLTTTSSSLSTHMGSFSSSSSRQSLRTYSLYSISFIP